MNSVGLWAIIAFYSIGPALDFLIFLQDIGKAWFFEPSSPIMAQSQDFDSLILLQDLDFNVERGCGFSIIFTLQRCSSIDYQTIAVLLFIDHRINTVSVVTILIANEIVRWGN